VLSGSPLIVDRESDCGVDRKDPDVDRQRDHKNPIEFRVCAAAIALRSSRIAADTAAIMADPRSCALRVSSRMMPLTTLLTLARVRSSMRSKISLCVRAVEFTGAQRFTAGFVAVFILNP
jgi:hypothetical protein